MSSFSLGLCHNQVSKYEKLKIFWIIIFCLLSILLQNVFFYYFLNKRLTKYLLCFDVLLIFRIKVHFIYFLVIFRFTKIKLNYDFVIITFLKIKFNKKLNLFLSLNIKEMHWPSLKFIIFFIKWNNEKAWQRTYCNSQSPKMNRREFKHKL